MGAVLALVGAVVLAAVIVLFVMKRQRTQSIAWQAAAKQLGGRATGSGARALHAVIDGRPVAAFCVTRGRGREARVYTEIAGAIRHPDDLAAGTLAPPLTVAAWTSAFQDAETRAGLADLPRPPLPVRVELDLSERGVISDPQRLVDLLRTEAAACTAYERPIAQWAAVAAALDLKVRAAYLLESEQRGCKVRIVADHVSGQIVVRAFGEARGSDEVVAITTGAPPGGMEELARGAVAPAEGYVTFGGPRGEARINDAVRAALVAARPSSVVASAQAVSVVVPGVAPDADRWGAAITLAVELAAVPSAGAFR